MKRLILGALAFAGLCFALPALLWATSPAGAVSACKATGYTYAAMALDNGCGPPHHTEADGVVDFFGDGGGVAEGSDAGDQVTCTVTGAALSAWQGTGTRVVGVTRTMRSSFGSTMGSTQASVYGALGFTMEVTYYPVAGQPVTHLFTQQPIPGGGVSTINVPQYNGQLASVDVNLQCITLATLHIETLVSQCHLAEAWVETVGTASINL